MNKIFDYSNRSSVLWMTPNVKFKDVKFVLFLIKFPISLFSYQTVQTLIRGIMLLQEPSDLGQNWLNILYGFSTAPSRIKAFVSNRHLTGIFWPTRFDVTIETIVSIVTSNLIGQNQSVRSRLSNQFLYTIQCWLVCVKML